MGEDFRGDLKHLGTTFGLIEAILANAPSCGTLEIRLVAFCAPTLEAAKAELMQSGLLEHYMAQVRSQSSSSSSCDNSVLHTDDCWHDPPLAESEERIDPEDGRAWTWKAFQHR